MSKDKPPKALKKNEVSIVRSSAAEYLTFVASAGQGGVEAVFTADGNGYNTQHYSLPAIIAVSYKVNSERAVQFRKWATSIIELFAIKSFAMDDERLKNDGAVLTEAQAALKAELMQALGGNA